MRLGERVYIESPCPECGALLIDVRDLPVEIEGRETEVSHLVCSCGARFINLFEYLAAIDHQRLTRLREFTWQPPHRRAMAA
jgi:RNase P subunit RPR2